MSATAPVDLPPATAPATTPAPPSPLVSAQSPTGTPPSAPAVSVSAGASSDAFKALEQKNAELASRLAATDDVLAKLRTALVGEQPVDPQVAVQELRAQAQHSTELAARAIVSAEVARFAARENAHDLEDVCEHIASRAKVEIDWATGRVKDATQIASAVASVKAAKPHWFKGHEPAANPVPLQGRTTQSVATPPAAVNAAPRLGPIELLRAPLATLKNAVNGATKAPV